MLIGLVPERPGQVLPGFLLHMSGHWQFQTAGVAAFTHHGLGANLYGERALSLLELNWHLPFTCENMRTGTHHMLSWRKPLIW